MAVFVEKKHRAIDKVITTGSRLFSTVENKVITLFIRETIYEFSGTRV
jgi:soluble P-type ATPase